MVMKKKEGLSRVGERPGWSEERRGRGGQIIKPRKALSSPLQRRTGNWVNKYMTQRGQRRYLAKEKKYVLTISMQVGILT